MAKHRCLHWLATGLGVLALAACASQPTAMTTAPAGPTGGTWIVTDAFPAGAVTDMASAPRGQLVRLEAGMAGDSSGRACPWPVYRDGSMPLESVLGSSSGSLPGRSPVLEVDCAGQRFSTYAVMADGSLLTRHGAWLLRLERGDKLAANPAPMLPDAPPMMLTPATAPEPAHPLAAAEPSPPAAPTMLVYLASYKTEAWAKKGWGILAAQSASLKAAEPVTRSVDIKDKGTFIRLFAPAKTAAEGKRICAELGKAISDCGATGREK